MSMQFTMSSGGVPAGTYQATFTGVEAYNENVDKYGAGVSLKFRVIGGDHDGAEASRICAAKLSPKSALAKFATALKGAAIASGETFSFDAFVGTQGNIVVEPTEGGGTRVSAFIRTATQPPVTDTAAGQAATF